VSAQRDDQFNFLIVSLTIGLIIGFDDRFDDRS